MNKSKADNFFYFPRKNQGANLFEMTWFILIICMVTAFSLIGRQHYGVIGAVAGGGIGCLVGLTSILIFRIFLVTILNKISRKNFVDKEK